MDLSKLDVGNLIVRGTNKTVNQVMKEEADRLVIIIQNAIRKQYASYEPKKYIRKYKMMNSVDVSNLFKLRVVGKIIYLDLQVLDTAYHKSLVGGTSVLPLLLLNYGYATKNARFKDVPYFGFRKGTNFLGNAIKEFNATSQYGVFAKITWPYPGLIISN